MTTRALDELRQKIFKDHDGWAFVHDEFSGTWAYIRDDGLAVYCTPDYEEQGFIDVQVYDENEGMEPAYADGVSVLVPWPDDARTPESWAEVMKPILDRVSTDGKVTK